MNTAFANKKKWEQEYEVTIESSFDNPDCRTNFTTFLKESFNDEPILFYEAVEQFHHLRLLSNIKTRANEIYQRFIAPQSSKEVNLSQEVRKRIQKDLQEMDEKFKQLEQEPSMDVIELRKKWVDVFDYAQTLIFKNLKEDTFPRYIRSSTFKNFIAKDLSILTHVGIRRSNSSSSSNLCKDLLAFFAPQDLGSQEFSITDRDFSFVESLKRDSLLDWKLFKKPLTGSNKYSTVQAFGSKKLFEFKDAADPQHKSGERLFKFTGIADYPFEVVWNLFLDEKWYEKMDPNIAKGQVLEVKKGFKDHSGNNQYSYLVIHSNMKFALGPLVSYEREAVFAKSCKLDPSLGKGTIVLKSVQHPKVALSEKIKRITIYGGVTIERVTENTTRFTVGYYTDLKIPKYGNETIAAMIYEFLGGHRAQLFEKNLTATCKEFLQQHSAEQIEQLMKQMEKGEDSSNIGNSLQTLIENMHLATYSF